MLDGCTDDRLRREALGYLNSATIDMEERLKVLERMYNIDEPSLACKCELAAVYGKDMKKRKELEQDIIRDYWWWINHYIYEYGDFFGEREERSEPPLGSEKKILLIEKCMGIFYALFDKDDLGEYLFYEGQYNEFLAREYLKTGKIQEALDCFEKSVDGWLAYNNLPDRYEYKSVLTDRLVYDKSKQFQGGDYPNCKRYRSAIDKNSVYNVVRDNPRFKAAYDKLIQR